MDIKVKSNVATTATAESIFESILHSRGYTTKSEQDEFLHPPEPTISFLRKHADLKLSVLNSATRLLDSHLTRGDDVLVFGDYDADGVTATAIMWQALVAYAKITHSTSRILPFIPDRLRHGYGLGVDAVSDVLDGTGFTTTQYPDFRPKLVVTVDTGIVADVGIARLRDSAIDIIITDHHQPTMSLPNASVIVHTLPTSGAGLAWIFALHLLGDQANVLLDLATIGVVADMMPLTRLNRSLVAHGLSALSRTRRPGLLAMKAAMGVGEKALTTYDLSFGIAPRINAAGRIYSPLDALRLLCTSDPAQAAVLAQKIESHNHDRQEYTDRALLEVGTQQVPHHVIITLGDYHEGVIGLVASKLVEKFHRPAVVMSQNDKVVKGSARSIPGVNITALLRTLHTPFLGLGGHEQAAGFSLDHTQVSAFTRELEAIADQVISVAQLVKTESADLELTLPQTTLALAELVGSLEPFGLGNPKPKFLLHNLTVLEDRSLGKEDKHHKLTVVHGTTTREVLMFNTQHTHPLKSLKSLICSLDINVWRDKKSLQLIASYVET